MTTCRWAVLAWCGLTSAVAADWTAYTSPRGNFRTVFPAPPQETVKTLDSEYGPIPYVTCVSELDDGNVGFCVAYNDHPPAALEAGADAILDGGRDGALKNLKGVIASEIQLTHRGYPGREFTILGEVQGRKLFCHTRLLLVGARLYQLQILRVGDAPIDLADGVRFFSSFEQLASDAAAP